MFEGKTYCGDCCEKCSRCGKPTPRDELENINTADGCQDVCPACYDLYDQCAFCGNECPKEKLHEIDGEWYCEDCLPKYIAQLKGEERAQAMRQLDATLAGIAAGLAIFRRRDVEDRQGHDQPRGLVPADDDEADYDDGYPDDHVDDGLDGTDDYVGDGLDGPDDDGDDPE